MSGVRSALVVPLVVVAVLGGVLGFLVTKQLAPEVGDGARVSVITLPSTPTPEPTPAPTPTATPGSEADEDGGRASSGRRGGSGGLGSCPAGCTCESRPPSGVVIVCRGS